ncbi:MAG: tRNA pseudouridine(55) synthase TruB [Pseudomonadota bacterium]|jgi:tRNA pseudouridine55 synthase
MNAPVRKKVWRPVDGVLLLDKASGMSSNDALQKARRLFSAAKAGHTGTLDPLASGLLPLCFGEATKFAADLLDADKTYEATLLLGVTTDTGDAEGVVTQTRPVVVDAARLEAALPAFRGPISQVPPMHSALKRDGRPLYELARQGIEVEREARNVVIHQLDVLEFAGSQLRLRVRCSKGTYIRVLAADLGEALGCGAHLTALRRTEVGELQLAGAQTLEAIAAIAETSRDPLLQPLDALLQKLPQQQLDAAAVARFSHGNPVAGEAAVGSLIRVYAAENGQLLGVGEVRPDHRLWPKRLLQSSAKQV